jgi:hypothetical protein
MDLKEMERKSVDRSHPTEDMEKWAVCLAYGNITSGSITLNDFLDLLSKCLVG